MMTCRDVNEDLALAAAGVLDEDRRALLDPHLRECPQCARRLREYEGIRAAHSSVAAELAQVRFKARESYSPEPATAPTNLFWGKSWRWILPISAAAAVALILAWPQRHASPSAKWLESAGPPLTTASSPGSAGSLAAYRKALRASGEASLDVVLTRDANVLLRPSSQQEIRSLRADLY